MKKKNISIMFFLSAALLLSACKNNTSTDKEALLTDIPKPTEAVSLTITPEPTKAPDTPTPSVSSSPASITSSPELDGYTPLGIKLLHSSEDEINTVYIYINSEEGWKAVYEPIGMFKEYVTLYKTEDGGNHWSQLTSTEDEDYSIPIATKTGLIFTDSMHGWLTTEIPQSGYIGLYQTSDGGTSWEQQQLEIPEAYSEMEFETYPPVFFTEKDALLLTYSPDAEEQLVFVTHDSGKSWNRVKEKEDNSLQWSYKAIASGSFAEGFTIVYNQDKWNTKDGITWEKSN